MASTCGPAPAATSRPPGDTRSPSCWTHFCTVGRERVDPLEALGIVPDKPLPYFGWGDIPDQYRRGWDGDDGESELPEDPGLVDLPPLEPGWSPPDRKRRLLD